MFMMQQFQFNVTRHESIKYNVPDTERNCNSD